MHVVVVGAGIIGVCTAYFLRRAGMEVTVVERRPGVAQETSFANAGLLAPSCVAPWAQPGMPGKVVAGLFRAEAPVVFRPSTNPALWGWIRRWLAECDPDRFAHNRSRMQRLAFYSRSQLSGLRALHGIDYEQSAGCLLLFRTVQEVERSESTRAMLRKLGVAHTLLTADEARAAEASLHPVTALAGALHLPEEETGNCAFFAHQLKGIAVRDGVNFRFGVAAEGFDSVGGTIERLRTSRGELRADAFVVAGGVDSLALLRPLGIRLPLIAVKGYSATAAISALDQAPMTSVIDESYRVAITRMGNRLRIAGTAEVGTSGMKLRDGALRTLLKVASDWFPSAAVYRRAQFWVGARPMLPDGSPVLGPSPIRNLFLNTGHGSTGWAMACGSGRIVADIIAGQPAEIDLDGLTIDRYDRRRAA
jgi:D-amino-acid dehydrogenase